MKTTKRQLPAKSVAVAESQKRKSGNKVNALLGLWAVVLLVIPSYVLAGTSPKTERDAKPAAKATATATATAPAPTDTLSTQRAILDVLLENGVITREQYNQLTGMGTSGADRTLLRDLLDDDDDFGYTATDLRTRRFRVRSEDGRDLFRLRGRFYLDGAGLFLDDNKNTVDDSRNNRGELARYATIVRSARIGAEGVMYEDFLWRTEVDFRDEEVRLRGAYIEYIRYNPFRIMIGNIKEPMGIEWMTSRNRATFLERGPSLDAFKPDWTPGLRLEYRGFRYNLMAALMSGGDLARDRTQTGGYAFAGRASVAPYVSGSNFTHIGFGSSYRVNAYSERIDGQFDRQYSDIRLRTRLGTRAIDGRFIGADDVQDAVDITRYNAEGAFGFGPFSVQGEYTMVNIRRDFFREDLFLNGFYVQASYFLTGESRTYRPERGNFGALIPNRNFRPGFGPGAIELAVRFSNVDSIDQDYDGGQMDHFTAGLNWYLNRETRIMLNYIWLDAKRQNGKQSTGSVVAARVMFEF